MYKITKDNSLIGYSETAVYIKLHQNGSYVPCNMNEAEGVCVKLPFTYTHIDEETKEEVTVNTVKDTVFALKENALHGTEEVVSLEEINGALLLQGLV